MSDKINIEILEDGQICFETDGISGKNHASADDFLAEIEKLAGGIMVKQKKKGIHKHTHTNNAVHVH